MIVNRIYDWAATQPGKPAIIHNDQPISYAGFAHRIDAARRFLSCHDLPVGMTAVVMVLDQLEAWLITLALRTLGMNTIVATSPGEAENLGLKDVGAVMTTRFDAARLALTRPRAFGRRIVVVPDSIWQGPAHGVPPPIDDPDRPYGGHILYTSGTTGVRKKVLTAGRHEEAQSERCAVHRLLGPDSIVHNLNFSLWTGVGYKQPLAVWRMGATLIIDNRPDVLRDFFRHRPTFVSMTPAVAHELLAKTATSRRPDNMPIVNLGGGFASPQLVRQLRSAKFDRVMISYSSTECSHVLRSQLDDEDQLAWLAPVTDRHIDIVNVDGRPCAVGEEGALRIALLDHDAHGYLDDPAASAAIFRDGWFYPGDLAVRRDDGRIRILGRIGDVLNVAGAKIAMAPFEQSIAQLLGLENVCLFQHVDAKGAGQLIVVIEADAVPDAAMIKRATAGLPAFDRLRFEAVKPFPRTRTGLRKIQRAELRTMVLGPAG